MGPLKQGLKARQFNEEISALITQQETKNILNSGSERNGKSAGDEERPNGKGLGGQKETLW